MKRKLIYFFSVLAIIACTNEDLPDFTTHEEYNKNAIDSFYVPYETALQHALKVLNHDSAATRALGTERKVSNHYEYVANKATRSNGGGDTEVRFHVINFEDNQGFALVSADSRTTPVYAYSETGNLDMDDAIENSGFDVFMVAAEEYYMNEIILPTLPDTIDTGTPTPITPVPGNPILQLPIVEFNGVYYYLGGDDVVCTNPGGILLGVEWHQDWPYNYYCGRNDSTNMYAGYLNRAGCGPIAAAQIMSYFKYPASFDGYTFDWEKMSQRYFPNDFSPRISESAKSVAHLVNLIGIESKAIYGVSTSTYIADMDDMFRNFGYSCTGPVDYNVSKVMESLDNSSPVYFRGQNNSNSSSGHAWVIDAYRQSKSTRIYYHMQEPYNIYTTTITYGDVYYHCNWGWINEDNSAYSLTGNHNGWYLDVFSVNGSNYSSHRQMIYNIAPNN